MGWGVRLGATPQDAAFAITRHIELMERLRVFVIRAKHLKRDTLASLLCLIERPFVSVAVRLARRHELRLLLVSDALEGEYVGH